MRARLSLALACLIPLCAASFAAASLRYAAAPDGISLAAAVDAACASPSSPACAAALEQLALSSAFQLRRLGQRRDAAVRPLAVDAAAAAYPALRAAAADALAELPGDPADTPILAELLDDPVPAVRMAALRALRRQVDEAGRRLARRTDVFGRIENVTGEDPETPPQIRAIGVPLPADAVFLNFASDPSSGRFAFVTAQPPAKTLAALRGRGPFTPQQFREQIPGAKPSGSKSAEEDGDLGGLPSPEEMERLMELAATMGELAKKHRGRPEELAAATAKAMKAHGSFDGRLADAYRDEELFGGARLVVVPLAGGGEAVVSVYEDRVLGTTGVAVHRAPLDGGE